MRVADETNSKFEDVSRATFLRTELERLGYGEAPSPAPELADVDDLLVVALEEDLQPELLDALVWVVERYPVDVVYQYDMANTLGTTQRWNQVLTAIRERGLRIHGTGDRGVRVDLLEELKQQGLDSSN